MISFGSLTPPSKCETTWRAKLTVERFRSVSTPRWGNLFIERKTIVQSNLELVQQILKSKMTESIAITGLRDSIRIHQVADPLDMTQESAEREMAVENLDRETTVVRRLHAAIERLDRGSYGVCLQCEELIEPKRLKAIPWAEFCIICQEWAERSAGKRELAMNASIRANAA
jgi:DnaK suppressor protein